jgi:hypothetical protein
LFRFAYLPSVPHLFDVCQGDHTYRVILQAHLSARFLLLRGAYGT